MSDIFRPFELFLSSFTENVGTESLKSCVFVLSGQTSGEGINRQ